MKPKILPLPTFMRETKRLLKRYRSLWKDLEGLQEELLANPTLGTDLGRGLRKVRMRISSKGKGKSGGARVITFTVIASVDETTINLLYIYDKSERENISPKEIDMLLIANGFIAQP
ncbi:type II toxin-antitoxin system RelE/ParE family toxin [Phocaeicola sp. Sa1CVN1]|uniref:Type II toxin-antitoxin system RelE/ParE family toxin n=1 Tax=Phocaeicola intestinalis TaxID=2762212 RepID=A0ABR8Y7Q1_9BACT|nr:type II toxin-antitoxin system RelE/ParE family toxin [Phocaeicola intestinalis]MBD8040235.1 type II toxin-antitoxin system RelE/ParE family toxin [Phocaeicola intestinalis]